MQGMTSLSLKIVALDGPGDIENSYRVSMMAEFEDGTYDDCDLPVLVSRHSVVGRVGQNLLQTCLVSLETLSSAREDEGSAA